MKKHISTLLSILFMTSVTYAGRISESDARDITDKYIEAILEKDFSKWSELMLSTYNWTDNRFKETLDESSVKVITLKNIIRTNSGYDICLQFDSMLPLGDGSSRDSYWVQLLKDGAIKYDLLIPHPVSSTMIPCHVAIIYAEKKGEIAPECSVMLKDSGIPLFGYDTNASIPDQLESLKQIKNWLLSEGVDWDSTEPKIPCPEALYKTGKRSLLGH